MEWVLLFALVSGLGNVWQYGETKELQTQLLAAYKIASACQAARQDTRDMELIAADERAEAETTIRGIFIRSELDTREINTSSDLGSDSNCLDSISTNGSKGLEIIIKRTQDINNQWMHSPSKDVR